MQPTCGKCGSVTFQAGTMRAADAPGDLLFVWCVRCGLVAGIVDPSVTSRLEALEATLGGAVAREDSSYKSSG